MHSYEEPPPVDDEVLAAYDNYSPAPNASPVTEIGKPFPLVAVRDVSEIHEQRWLVKGLIPRSDEGAAGYLFGPPKARKSLLTSELALCVTTGEAVLGNYEVQNPGAAVGFFAEDAKSETARRIHRLARGRGIDVPHNLSLIDVPSLRLDSPVHQRSLLATLSGVADLSFVWLDPMVRLHSINDNRAEELGPIHTFLRSMVRQLPGVVVMLAHHTNKAGGSRGSTDYDAFGDFNIFLETAGAETTKASRIENRGGPPGDPFAFTVEDGEAETGRTMKLVLSEETDDDRTDSRADAITDQLRHIRAGDPKIGYRDAQKQLRLAGVKAGNDTFSACWKASAD